MKIIVEKDCNSFSAAGASMVAGFINAHPGALLCLAAGDTPLGIYRELIEWQQRGEVDLNSVYYVGLDEWAGIGYETKGSCEQVMRDHFFGPAGIATDHARLWDGLCGDTREECEHIDRFIGEKGGIALALLGIGMNGHIGFNEPFTDTKKSTLTVDLDDVTKEVGRKYFSGSACPAQGLTVGLGRLRETGEVILIANEAKKGDILKKSLADSPTPVVPASLLQDHPNLTVLADGEAFKAMFCNH